MPARARIDARLILCAALSAGVAPALSSPSAAQNPVPPAPTAGLPDGRAFAGVDLPASPQPFSLGLVSRRAWSWREEDTQRLLLDRDVRVTIGPYGFQAKRASVWIEPVRIGEQNADQVALVLDGVTDPGGQPVAQAADRLLVTAILTGGATTLATDLLDRSRPDAEPFLAEAEARLARYLVEAEGGAALARATGRAPGAKEPDITESIPPDPRGPLPPAERSPAVQPERGLVHLFAPNIELIGADERAAEAERAVLLSGGIVVQYARENASTGAPEQMELSAQRAVVFLHTDAGPGLAQYRIKEVIGVYLEGDVVAGNGTYTLRGARVYYDIATERAIVLDAVFWTYDQDRGMPLYLRADAIRQRSQQEWNAKKVTLANVGFAEPHFAIGAAEVTITSPPRVPAPGASETTRVEARDVTLTAAGLPLAYVPNLRGDFKPSVLRRATVDSEAGDAIVRTGWDLYALLGLDAAEGNEATLLLDGYARRGVGMGADVSWKVPDIRGSFYGYYINDNGTDHLPSGSEEKHDHEPRGIVLADQVWRLGDNWTLFLEGSYISDPTFVPAFHEDWAEARREFANSIYARHLDDNTALELEARGTFNDFVANEYLLESLGYMTQKLPEVAYSRMSDELFDGLLRYNGQTSVANMKLAFTEPTVKELGFKSTKDAEAAFGLTPSQSIGDELRAEGYTEDGVLRFDTRHEFEAPLEAGAFNIVPFVVGRVTAWDNTFDSFSGEDNPSARLWGAAGLRLATSLSRVDDTVEFAALDLHRIRHIIEPNATLWYAGTNLEQTDLPIYDDDVESLANGATARMGVRNTWQTYRGGADGRRSVDWIILNTDYIWSSGEVDRESPLGRFIEARPEQSNLGEYINNDFTMHMTDALALTSNLLYSFDDTSLARATAGVLIDHGYGFSTLVEYRYLDTPRTNLLDLGARYELTRKIAAIAEATYDTERSEFQSMGLRVERRFPQWTVDFRFGLDNISNDVTVGIALRPVGVGNEDRRRVFIRDPHDPMGIGALLPERESFDEGPLAR